MSPARSACRRGGQEQLEELISGFNRLNQFGEASGRQVMTLRGKIDEALGAFGEQAAQLEQIAATRFVELAERSAAFRADLDGREVETFAQIRRRADALRDELEANARSSRAPNPPHWRPCGRASRNFATKAPGSPIRCGSAKARRPRPGPRQ
jgi:hypothetical protein